MICRDRQDPAGVGDADGRRMSLIGYFSPYRPRAMHVRLAFSFGPSGRDARFPLGVVRFNLSSAPPSPRRGWSVLSPAVASQHRKFSCNQLIIRRGPMPRFHRARDGHGQYVGEMCGDPGFVPSARAKGIRNCRRKASYKRLKVSNIFRRTLEAESIGLEKIPSQSPAVTLCTGGEVRSPAPNARKSAALGTDLTNSEKVQKHELAEGRELVSNLLRL